MQIHRINKIEDIQNKLDAKLTRHTQLVFANYIQTNWINDTNSKTKWIPGSYYLHDVIKLYLYYLCEAPSYPEIERNFGVDDTTACRIINWIYYKVSNYNKLINY
jgi:hypothetical protein